MNPEEASSTPGAKVKKTKGWEEMSSSNVKDMKTENSKEKSKATKKRGSPANVAKPSIRVGSVADFLFQYPASMKPYRFRGTERNCALAYPQSNGLNNWK